MKRLSRLLLAVLIISTMLPAFAFAGSTNPEYTPISTVSISTAGEYFIGPSGNYDSIHTFDIGSNTTIIIPRSVTVKVSHTFRNAGTVIVDGTLIVEADPAVNRGTITESCTATLTGQFQNKLGGKVIYGNHKFEDSKCARCGYVCGHKWNNGVCSVCNKICKHKWNNGVCSDCGTVCQHDRYTCVNCGIELHASGNVATGAILSEGSVTIIVGAFCLAVGFLLAMFFFRKPSTINKAAIENANSDDANPGTEETKHDH